MKPTFNYILRFSFALLAIASYSQNAGSLKLDGHNDFLSTNAFLNGESEITLMAWVKLDNGSSKEMVIAGENDSFKLFLKNGRKPALTVTFNETVKKTISSSSIKANQWHHITGVFNGSTGNISLLVDGLMVSSSSIGSVYTSLSMTNTSNGNFEIGRLSANASKKYCFGGEIDEVRIFDKALTEDQIQRMVYQEISNNNGHVRGTIIPNDIIDIDKDLKVSWSNLIAYYPMTDITSLDSTKDFSENDRPTQLNNMHSIAAQTAPMPYVTMSNGYSQKMGTWLHGQVWDILDFNDTIEWRIVQINHDVSLTHSFKNLGLFVSENSSLNIMDDKELNITWYLSLKGTIDFKGESQLIQGMHSDLVTSSTGRILKRQQGNANHYRYNYWSAPVGAMSATMLTDNNMTVQNSNNTPFKLSFLEDSNGDNIQFTTESEEANKISKKWLYTFKNGVTYNDWSSISEDTEIKPGVGYTHKGTNNNSGMKEYTFEGKPNNGTILLDVSDLGGNGSVPGVSMTSYLIGNPYASALNVEQFIDDNVGVISGTIRMWQQWGGDSHSLSDYEGGYAEVNKMGSVRAYQFDGLDGDYNGDQNGTCQPTKYICVGQGFVVEILSNGKIEFNNGQRTFVTEGEANGDFNSGSVFLRQSNSNEEESGETSDMTKIKLEFNNVSGPKARRELLLGFSESTTDAFDYGYDSENTTGLKADDLNLILNEKNLTMQAYSQISENMEINLNFKASGSYIYSIKASSFENLASGQGVFLKDNLTGEYFDLKNNSEYTFSSDAGEFNQRFVIVFNYEAQRLSDEALSPIKTVIFYNSKTNELFVKGLDAIAKSVSITNMLGQRSASYNAVPNQTLDNGMAINNLASGVYIATVVTAENNVVDTKFIVK